MSDKCPPQTSFPPLLLPWIVGMTFEISTTAESVPVHGLLMNTLLPVFPWVNAWALVPGNTGNQLHYDWDIYYNVSKCFTRYIYMYTLRCLDLVNITNTKVH